MFSLLWHGRYEFHSRLNRLVKFFPISFTGKLAFVIVLITFMTRGRSFRFSLFKNVSINGTGAFMSLVPLLNSFNMEAPSSSQLTFFLNIELYLGGVFVVSVVAVVAVVVVVVGLGVVGAVGQYSVMLT